MIQHERRRPGRLSHGTANHQLTDPQLAALRDLRQFGWELMFVRHQPFQPPMTIVYDAQRQAFAVIEPDGHLNESPDLRLRA